MKKSDVLLYLFLIMLLLTSILINISLHDNGNTVKVNVNGTLQEEYPLKENRTVLINGENNINLELIIDSGNVHVENAECPDKICEHSGSISKANQAIVCLPGRIVITVDSDDESQYDSISR